MTPEQVYGLYNYWIVICLMMTGFYIVIARKNMVKTVIGLNIFQTSVFLLYITMGKVAGGTAPIVPPHLVEESHGHGDHSDNHAAHGAEADHAAEANHALESVRETTQPASEIVQDIGVSAEILAHAHDQTEIIYSNPLPSVLMLTAIVVGIATTALALALIVRIREDYGTIEEDEILLMDREQ